MDFHALPRRDLQALCKRNGVRANMTNAAMAEALAALPTVDGIEEFIKQPVATPAPAAKSAVKAVTEEDPRENKGSPLPRCRRVTVSSPEVIKLDDSDEEAPGENKGAPLPRGRRGTVRSSKVIRPKDGEEEGKEDENREENAPALGAGRRGASRRARAEPVVAPTTRRRAVAASKNETGGVVAEVPPAPTTRRRAQTSTEAEPAPTTRRRTQTTVAAPAEEKVTTGRRTTREAAERKPAIQQEEEEDCIQGVVKSNEPAPISDAGCDDTDEVVETGELAAEQNSAPEEPVQEEEGIKVEVRAETVEAVAKECSPDVVVEEMPVQEEEGIEVEAPAETEAVAQECSPDAVVEEKQVAVEVEQPISLDDSPIPGLVSDTTVGQSEEAPVCNSECPMDMVTEESSDTVSEEKEAVPADEVPQATLTYSETTGDAEFPADVGDAKEEEDEMEAVDEADFAVDGLNGALTEYADNAIQLNFSAEVSCADEDAGVVITDGLLQSSATVKTMVSGSEVTEEAESAVNVGHGSEEQDALEAVNEAGSTVEERGVETVDEPHDTLSNAAYSDIQLEEDALEVVNVASFAVEKGVETVDEPHDTPSNAADSATQLDLSEEISRAVEGEGVVAAEAMQKSSAAIQDVFNSEVCHAVEQNEMATVERASPEKDDMSEGNVFTGDLTLKSDGPRDLGDHITSVVPEGAQTLPQSPETLDVTYQLSTMVTVDEATVDVSSHCMHGSSDKNRNTELSEIGEGKEVKVENKQKKDVELAKLSLRTLRAKIKEKLIANHKRKEAKRVALGRLDENVC